MDKITGNDIDINTVEQLNVAKVAISDEIISEMAIIAQQYVKITFLLDKLENLLKSE